MRKVCLCIGILAVLAAFAPLGLFAQQSDLQQMARDLSAKNDADRTLAYDLAARYGWPVRGTGQDGSFFELQKMIHGFPKFYSTFNANAAKSTRTDSVNAVIGGGSGFVLRLWDAGKPRTTHREYAGRITWADPLASSIHYHSTHVAGTLIASGVRADAKGMSYQATIRAFEWTDDASEMASEAAGGALLSNHSYGYLTGWYNPGSGYWYWYGDTAVSEVEDYLFGFYDSEARYYDQILNAAPNYLPVVSAANDRDDYGPGAGVKHYYWDARYSAWRFSTKTRNADGTPTGYDCLPFGFQVSKNTLTVGAVYDVLTYTGPSSVVLAAFSSTGPCDDGRIKPDVVGNGMELLSSYSTNDSSYAIGSGTSMSSPNVCGSLGLLADYYKDTHSGTPMWASTIKALAIHTALEAGSGPGPDYTFGWGLLNAYAAYNLLNKDYMYNAKGFIEELTISNGQTLEYWYRVPAGAPELRATICWNDPAGTPPAASLDPTTKMLVNDLDLRVVKGLVTNYPWRLDVASPSNAATKADNNIDNVEQVLVTSPAAGVYAIRITHKGTLASPQKVSLIVSGAEKNHVWHVYADGSGDAPTIGAAVSASSDGDSIYVHQGSYHEAGISVGKALVITGVDGAALTTVDGTALGASCFIFPAVSKVIMFRGFTIKSGSSGTVGGGASCSNSSVTIERCVFKSCLAATNGGGMAVVSASPAIRSCTFDSNQAGSGGGVYLSSSSAVFDSCIFYDNVATGLGGGVAIIGGTPQFNNCTIHHNTPGTNGGGVYIGTSGNPSLTRCLVTFAAAGGGIYGALDATGATITCCDVYGNTGGNYGGSIADPTGTNNNVSLDPVYCVPGASPPTLSISSLSPCAPASSPCGQLIGALGVGCVKGADLVIASVGFSDMNPALGDSITATVKVKNVGAVAAAKSFYIDYYKDLSSPPSGSTPGDERYLVAGGLAAGDSVTWVTPYVKASAIEVWASYFRVDTGDSIVETNEGNNLSGPHTIEWRFPQQAGWPVAGVSFHSSPAIASVDSNETTLETIIGCDDGNLYVLKSDGTNAFGWPVAVGDTLFSSPAVADISGDYHKEIVIGAKDGKIYAYDFLGAKLWDYATGSAVKSTPALADLDRDGKCEVLASSGGNLYALEGDGSPMVGSWPYSAGAGTFASPAVGDVDGDGALEIAAVSYGYTAPVQSLVHLLLTDGTLFSGSWPVAIDTVVVSDPVLGNVISPASDLEIAVGGVNGKVYVLDASGALWSTVPRVKGAIETSPMLTQIDPDDELEIVVSSRWYEPIPGEWHGVVTAVDNTGSICSGWPLETGVWPSAGGPVPSPVSIGTSIEVMAGSTAGFLYSWDRLGAGVSGFPISLGGEMLVSAAADDIDRDGTMELVAASAGGINCYELTRPGYATSELWWPMFRHDRARTGCYNSIVPTGVDEPKNATPVATRISSIYPNPFNPSTRIVFELSARGHVELSIYDVAGRKVAVLADKDMEAGRYEISWHGRTSGGAVAASGVYFCKLRAGSLVETKKMVLIR